MNSTTTRSTGNSGFTIIENIVAVGIIALGFAALYAMSARCMKIMYSARDEMTVGQALQREIEQTPVFRPRQRDALHGVAGAAAARARPRRH